MAEDNPHHATGEQRHQPAAIAAVTTAAFGELRKFKKTDGKAAIGPAPLRGKEWARAQGDRARRISWNQIAEVVRA